MKAALVYLRRALIPGPFLDSLVDLAVYEQTLPPERRLVEGRIVAKQHGPYPNTGRNLLVQFYLKNCAPEVDRLIMVDDDNVFKGQMVHTLAGMVDPVERPIMSGLYFAYRNTKENLQLRPLLMRRRPDGNFDYLWRYPSGQVEVDAIGMGFCCMHRSVLEQWHAAHGPTWFDYGVRPSGEFEIEDEAFCRRMQSIGKKIYVNTDLRVGHMKQINLDERLYVPPADK